MALNKGGYVEIDANMRTDPPYLLDWRLHGQISAGSCGYGPGLSGRREYCRCANLADPRRTLSIYAALHLLHTGGSESGLTEAQAKAAGYEVKVGKFPFLPNGKAQAINAKEGFVKLVVEAKYGEILGAHLVGHEVTELLPELSLAQFMEITPAEIARNVHSHPTLSEVVMEAAHVVEGHAIHI